jgi:type IV secretory pathway TrbD component
MLYSTGWCRHTLLMSPGFAPVRGIYYSQWAYWCTLVMAVMSFMYLPAGTARNLVILTPVLTALFGLSVVFWIYRSCDEYIRLRILKCAAVTGIGVVIRSR